MKTSLINSNNLRIFVFRDEVRGSTRMFDKQQVKNITYLKSTLMVSNANTDKTDATKERLVTKMETLTILQNNNISIDQRSNNTNPLNSGDNSHQKLVKPKAVRVANKNQELAHHLFDSLCKDEDKSELQWEMDERNEALDELSTILGKSSSCPSIGAMFERPACSPKGIMMHKSQRSATLNYPSRFSNWQGSTMSTFSSNLSKHEPGVHASTH